MAIKANIVVDQGTDYSTNITLTNAANDAIIDLTGYTANAAFRKTYTSSNATVFGTSVNATSGVITLSLSSNATANVVAGRYVYDVIVAKSGLKSRVVEGIVTVNPRVTAL